jgi:hypothetical protein
VNKTEIEELTDRLRYKAYTFSLFFDDELSGRKAIDPTPDDLNDAMELMIEAADKIEELSGADN